MKELENLKKLLDEEHDGPFEYLFKFIVPKEHALDIKAEFPHFKFENKESKTGKYISITFTIQAINSQDVIDVYKKVTKIPGIISL